MSGPKGGYPDEYARADQEPTPAAAPEAPAPLPGPGGEPGAADRGERPASWRNRVIRRTDVDPSELVPHPDNFRVHPEEQREVLAATIAEIGWVGEVYVSTFSGRILDGHARVEEAIASGQPSIPVAWVDCADAEDEARILATFNPVGTMARQDDGKLLELVNRANFADGRNSPIVAALAGLVGKSKSPKEEPGGRIIGAAFGPQGGGHLGKVGGLVYPIVVECESEETQDRLLEALMDEGHACYGLDASPSSIGDRQLHGIMEPGQPGDLAGDRR